MQNTQSAARSSQGAKFVLFFFCCVFGPLGLGKLFHNCFDCVSGGSQSGVSVNPLSVCGNI